MFRVGVDFCHYCIHELDGAVLGRALNHEGECGLAVETKFVQHVGLGYEGKPVGDKLKLIGSHFEPGNRKKYRGDHAKERDGQNKTWPGKDPGHKVFRKFSKKLHSLITGVCKKCRLDSALRKLCRV